MKKFLCTLVAFAVVLSLAPHASAAADDIPVDEAHFPDERFRNGVSKFCDLDENGSLSKDERDSVEELIIDARGISDLTGLSLFPNLKKLDCSSNKLTELYVSGFEKLEYLDCESNRMEHLNFGKGTNLKDLRCAGNELTELDVSGLEKLEILSCRYNPLEHLNLGKGTNLSELNCSQTMVTELNLQNIQNLTALACAQTPITNLDLSGHSKLEVLSCRGNDVEGEMHLYGEVQSVNVSGCTSLIWLDCQHNLIDALDLTGCTNLEYLNCDGNQLTELKIEYNPSMTRLYCGENLLTEVDLSKVPALTELSVYGNKLQTLDVEEVPNLTFLDCQTNQLTEIPLEILPELQQLRCGQNQLTHLNLEAVPKLYQLWCEENKLTELNLNCLKNLEIVYCYKNSLGTLDVHDLEQLWRLSCHRCDLTKLEITNTPRLTELYCFRNKLSQLELHSQENLQVLNCGRNFLKELDLTDLPNLGELFCHKNQLTHLDVSHNPSLFELHGWSNQLSELDLHANPHLTVLDMDGNPNLTIDFTNVQTENPELEEFSYGAPEEQGVDLKKFKGMEIDQMSDIVGGYFDGTVAHTDGTQIEESLNCPMMTFNWNIPGKESPVVVYLIERPDEDPGEPEAPKFDDVPEDAWFADAVEWAVRNGITSGTSETTFGPDDLCTRAHAVTFLWKASGAEDPGQQKKDFDDVHEEDYFYTPVQWAVNNQITAGVSENRFGPDETCTRCQIVMFLWKDAGAPKPEDTNNPFTDVHEEDFYYDAVLWAVENGITSGVSSDRFGPEQECTRAQAVTFLYAAYQE